LDLPTVVITFHPHPRVVVTPDNPPLLLTTPEEKVDLLKSTFNGSLVFLPFDEDLRHMTAERFARDILVGKFNIKALVVGFNHSFGHKRSGNIDNLIEIGKQEGFEVEVVKPIHYKDMPISSSRIRRVLSIGEFEDATRMLGHAYPIRGKVIKGLGEGRKMGWPTANLKWQPRKLLPAEGVYSCLVDIDGKIYRGMMFIGINMLNPDKTVSVEANVFDFNSDIYGKEITLYPSHYVRRNQRFDSQEELKGQITRDKQTVIKLLN